MRIGIVVAVAVLNLAAHSAEAQGRRVQVVTGTGVVSLGVYAAFADRDCDNYPQTSLQNGRCEWRNSRGRLVGEPPDLPPEQVAGGLVAAGIGGLMASGVWAPSRTVDTIFTAGAGAILLLVAHDDTYYRGTVHFHTDDGRRFTLCPRGDMTLGEVAYPDDPYSKNPCSHTSFSRLNAMWAGIATVGLAAGRWRWRAQSGPGVSLDVRPGGVRVSKTIAF